MVKNMFFVPKEITKETMNRILKERKDRKRKEIEEMERNMEKSKIKENLWHCSKLS